MKQVYVAQDRCPILYLASVKNNELSKLNESKCNAGTNETGVGCAK